MEINFLTVGIIGIAAIALLLFLIWKNRKDETVYEKEHIQSELEPERHQEESQKL